MLKKLTIEWVGVSDRGVGGESKCGIDGVGS